MAEPMGPGDLCAVDWGEDDYRVVKILAIEDGIVHVLLYPDKFVDRPFAFDPAEVEAAALIHRSFGIPHMPVSAEDFATWLPGIVGHEAASAEELEGYELWREAYERFLSRSGRTRS